MKGLVSAMVEEIIKTAKEVAVRAVKQAGQIAKDRFDRITDLQEKDEFGDVVTAVDYQAEAIILQEITRVFPDHRIRSEESGDNGRASDWLWMVDPLDGTNNFAIGIPVFSSSITLLYRSEPVLGVIYEPMVQRLYLAVKNEGASCNGHRMQVRMREELRKGTVGWIQGHHVQGHETAVRLRHYLDVHFRRMIRLWAPSLQWCMLAKGDLDGIVLFNSEGDDLYAGILMVKEAGGLVMDFDGNLFEGMDREPYLIACHPEHKDDFLEVVHEGLRSSRP
jgi:myo-inositol-1(or 4)-monophosphatase